MFIVLSPEEVIEGRQRLLDDLRESLLGNSANWRYGFPGNFKLYNALLRVFELASG